MRYLFFIIFILQTSLSQDLIINESMSKNNNAIYDEDGDTPDWIEIYNNSTNPINMGDYCFINLFTRKTLGQQFARQWS